MKHFVTKKKGGRFNSFGLKCSQNKDKKHGFKFKVNEYNKIACRLMFVFVLYSFIVMVPCFSPNKEVSTIPSDAVLSDGVGFSRIGEIYNGDGTFDKTNFNILLQQVSGIENITASNILALDEKLSPGKSNDLNLNIDAGEMRSFTTGDKTEGEDILVRFGGLDWTPTYLSKTKSDEIILTLWLSTNEQEAWQDRIGTEYEQEGSYYGFVQNPNRKRVGLYSALGGNWAHGYSDVYPSNMYGTSYINAVTLNNGGLYTKDGKTLTTATQAETNVFAPFTMSSNLLSKFIVTPSDVQWQEYGQDGAGGQDSDGDYAYSNDNWATDIPDEGIAEHDPYNINYNFYRDESRNTNYAEREHSDQWKNSKLWLPSVTETAHKNSQKGIWNTSTAQRILSDNFDDDINGNLPQIGSENTSFSTDVDMWSRLRSGEPARYGRNLSIRILGNGFINSDCEALAAVRPALHLNITEAAKTIKVPFDELVSNDPKNPDIYKTEENGSFIYHIRSFNGLSKIANYVNISNGEFNSTDIFLLENNIDCSDKDFQAIKNFSGTLDGQGYSIVNLSINSTNSSAYFIEKVNDCTIKNINFLNYDLSSSTLGAGLIGIVSSSSNAVLQNVHCEGKISGVYATGLCYSVSNFASLTIMQCSLIGDVVNTTGADSYGLIGYENNASAVTIKDCYCISNAEACDLQALHDDNSMNFTLGAVYSFSPDSNYNPYFTWGESGFSSGIWVLIPTANGITLPVLSWNLAIGENIKPANNSEISTWLDSHGFGFVD